MNVHPARAGLASILTSAKNIYISGGAAEIMQGPELLRRHPPRGAMLTGILTANINRDSWVDAQIGLGVRAFFLTPGLKRHLSTGLVEYRPWRYGMIERYLKEPGRFDTALAMLSPPDASGRCSFGVQADFLPDFFAGVDRVVGFINPAMPRTEGHAWIEYSSLAAVVDYDVPLRTMASKPADAAVAAIADAIVALIPDGAVVETGIGQIASLVIQRLTNHRRLSFHSGVIDDSILALEASGALDPARPIVAGTMVGTTAFYNALHENSRYSLRPVSYTHSFRVISGMERFHAVNTVLQVDLLGQASAETSGGRFVASPGGLPDFTRAALHSPGGRSIVAVRARTGLGQSPGVVALLDQPHLATVPASDADVVVTEFGVAHLRDMPLEKRGEAMIAIADPADRPALEARWRDIRDGALYGLKR